MVSVQVRGQQPKHQLLEEAGQGQGQDHSWCGGCSSEEVVGVPGVRVLVGACLSLTRAGRGMPVTHPEWEGCACHSPRVGGARPHQTLSPAAACPGDLSSLGGVPRRDFVFRV